MVSSLLNYSQLDYTACMTLYTYTICKVRALMFSRLYFPHMPCTQLFFIYTECTCMYVFVHYVLVNCRVPDEPVNGTILDYDNIDTIEGSVITFQCSPGFLPEGEMTATCTNAGIWSPDPAGVDCSGSEFLIGCVNKALFLIRFWY